MIILISLIIHTAAKLQSKTKDKRKKTKKIINH